MMSLDLYSACIATASVVLQIIVVWFLWPYLQKQRATGIKAKRDSKAKDLLNHLKEKAQSEPEVLESLHNILGLTE